MQVLNNYTRNTRIENEHGKWILMNENTNDENDIQILTKKQNETSKLICSENGTPQKLYKHKYAFKIDNNKLIQQDYILSRTSPSLPYYRIILLRRDPEVFKQKMKQLSLLHQTPEMRDIVTDITFEAELKDKINKIHEVTGAIDKKTDQISADTKQIIKDIENTNSANEENIATVYNDTNYIRSKADVADEKLDMVGSFTNNVNNLTTKINADVDSLMAHEAEQSVEVTKLANKMNVTGENVSAMDKRLFNVGNAVTALANDVTEVLAGQASVVTSENIIHALTTGFNGIYQAMNGPIRYQLFRSPDNDKGLAFYPQNPTMVFSHTTGSGVLMYVTTSPLARIGRYTYVIVDKEGTGGVYLRLFSDLTLLLLVDATQELLNGCTVVCSCDIVPVFLTPRV